MPQNTKPRRTHVALASALVGMSGVAIAAQVFFLSSSPAGESGRTTALRRLQPGSYLASILVASADVRTGAAQLRDIRIEPNPSGGLELLPTQNVRFTSIGMFSTMEQQVAANWSILWGSGEQRLAGCEASKTCSFVPSPGMQMLQIIARSGAFEDAVNVRVVQSESNPFRDALPDWASPSILTLRRLGVIQGYEDGRYGAADNLRRGQVMVLLKRVLDRSGLNSSSVCTSQASPAPASHYASSAMCLFLDRGWEPDAWADLDAEISRGEVAAYINRIFGPSLLRGIGQSQGAVLTRGQSFTDVSTDHWEFFDVGVMELSGIMTGNPDRSFGVDRALNRAEAAVIVDRLLQAIERHAIQKL
jgi:hypothetical protein